MLAYLFVAYRNVRANLQLILCHSLELIFFNLVD